MKAVLKLSLLGICTASLSGCAFSQNVLQGAYDNKAEKECRITSGAGSSIHTAAKSNCENGLYAPPPKDDLEPETKPKLLPEYRG